MNIGGAFAIVIAFIYTFLHAFLPSSLEVLIKIMPLLILLALVLSTKRSTYKKWLLLGLFFCMLGDAAIGFYFLAGLVLFLIGHIFYIIAFSKIRMKKPPTFIIALLLLYGAAMLTLFITTVVSSNDYLLAIAVTCYIAAILTMGLAAFATPIRALHIGALFFIVSDSVLAFNLFIIDVPFEHEIVMLTYYIAQLSFTYSIFTLHNYSEYRNKMIQ